MDQRIELGAIDEQVTSTDAMLPVFGMFLPTLFSITTVSSCVVSVRHECAEFLVMGPCLVKT